MVRPRVLGSRHGVGACGIGVVALYVLGVLTRPGQVVDSWLLGHAHQLAVGPLGDWLPLLARRWLPPAMALVTAAAAARAALAGGWRRLARAAVLVPGSVVVSRVLQDHLWRPRFDPGYGYPWNTFPSTHATLVTALAAASWLLLGRPQPWVRRLLAAVVGLTVLGNVVGYAHLPSDAVGSVLLVAAVFSLVSWTGRRPRP